VLVSIADRKLAVIENGMVLAYFPVAVGSAVSPSPTGEFQIVSRVANPTYFHNGVVMMAGRDNPVGTRWMGLNVKGYGIHGTNAPGSVGHATSHGCIRLRNRDVERLYSMLRVGDIVEIHKERDPEIVQMFGAPLDVAKAQVSVRRSGSSGVSEWVPGVERRVEILIQITVSRRSLCRWRSHSWRWWRA
jgi:hypothetical protein